MKKKIRVVVSLFASAVLGVFSLKAQNVFPTAVGSKVGIGTSAPAYPLQIHRGANPNGSVAIFGSTSTASVFNYSTTENTYLRGGKVGSAVYINDYLGAGSVVLGHPAQAATALTPAYAASTVSVAGNLTVDGDLTMGGSSTIYSPTRLYLAGGNMRLDLTNSGSYGVQTFSYSGTSPATGITGGIYQFVVGNGYVKIGSVTTPNPAGYKLYVDQGILTEKVKVAVAGTAQWADYVFAKEYKLMPLTYVEQYIKEHKHLPNVPSAEEMVKEGNDLHKTDAKLLEKIEELTLYVIHLNKEIELLKSNK
ncbi:MAG: hypothetical protein WAT19_07270 [Ferruginibacter sp.]